MGRRVEACTSRAHEGKQHSSSPPAHGYTILGAPVSSPLPFFRVFFCCEHKATIAGIVVAFRGAVWAYQCIDCTRLLLKQEKRMEQWRGWAQAHEHRGSHPAAVASLPMVSGTQGGGVLDRDSSGTPRGLCDSCYRRRKLTARGMATGPPSCDPPHPTPPHPRGKAVSAPSSFLALMHTAALPPTRLPLRPPSASRGDVTAGSSVAAPRLCG